MNRVGAKKMSSGFDLWSLKSKVFQVVAVRVSARQGDMGVNKERYGNG